MTMWALGHLEVPAHQSLLQELQLREDVTSTAYCSRTLRMMRRAKRVLKKHKAAAGEGSGQAAAAPADIAARAAAGGGEGQAAAPAIAT